VWNLNKPAPADVGRDYHLVLASNVLHTAANMASAPRRARPRPCPPPPTGALSFDRSCYVAAEPAPPKGGSRASAVPRSLCDPPLPPVPRCTF